MEITNTEVYGLKKSVIASGYPMSTGIDKCYISTGDMDRADKLSRNQPGTGHNCFLKGITVQADITAPQYWWLQFGRYHFADIVSSQSKMHCITEMDIKEQCNKYVLGTVYEELKWAIRKYQSSIEKENPATSPSEWFQIVVSNCPMGLQLTARITTNYLQLKTMHKQRRNHRLQEWQEFCDWIESLEQSEWITDNGN